MVKVGIMGHDKLKFTTQVKLLLVLFFVSVIFFGNRVYAFAESDISNDGVIISKDVFGQASIDGKLEENQEENHNKEQNDIAEEQKRLLDENSQEIEDQIKSGADQENSVKDIASTNESKSDVMSETEPTAGLEAGQEPETKAESGHTSGPEAESESERVSLGEGNESNPFADSALERIYGYSAYDTAVEVAKALKKELGIEKFDSVVITRGDHYADALSGSYFAIKNNAPILLVKEPKNKDDNKGVLDLIKESLSENGTIYILGGPNAVSDNVEKSLKALGYVDRIWGQSKYDTNLEILRRSNPEDEDLLIATGEKYHDALCASTLRKPILLVADKLKESQKEFLNGFVSEGTNLYILGGPQAVSESLEEEIAEYKKPERIQGETRFDTAIEVAKKWYGGTKRIALATEDRFEDAMVGVIYAHAKGMPVIFSAKTHYFHKAYKYIFDQEEINNVTIFGGPLALSDDVAAVDASGRKKTGLLAVSKKRYYTNKDGSLVKSKTMTLGGTKFTFGANGVAKYEKATQIPVLAYHRVVNDNSKEKNLPDNRFAISLSMFKSHIEYLVDNGFTTVSLEELYEWRMGKLDLPKNSVVITFDDGHYENYHLVLPVMKEYNIKGSVFTIGENITETTEPFKDQEMSLQLGMDLREGMKRAYPDFTLENHSYGLHKIGGNGSPVVVGMSKAEIDKDFKKWKTKRGDFFAYPFGKWTQAFVDSCKTNGVRLAFCFGNHGYAKINQNPLLMLRIGIYPSTTMSDFKAWVNGTMRK